MKLEILRPLHIRRASGDLHFKAGSVADLPDEDALLLLAKKPDAVRLVEPSGTVIEPENLPLEFSTYKSKHASTSDYTLPESGLQLDDLEADLIHQALNRTQGNRSKSAKLLGLSRDTLLYRMQKHGFATH